MPRSKFIISFLLLLLCSIYSTAQDITVDTVVSSIEEPPKENSENTEKFIYAAEPDTTLYATEKLVSRDSINQYKKSEAFAYAKNLDSILKSMQRKQEFNADIKPPEKGWIERFFESPITHTAFWILAISFVLIILYKLFFTKGFFQRPAIKNDINTLPEEEEVSIDGDYEKLIALAVADKNYRLAIRYLYLQTLQKLSASGAIVFAADKTNDQYRRELMSKPYKKDFAALTLNYEYVWYGEFEIDELIYIKLKTTFQHFHNQL
ncbi:hypothetical protein LK994_11835 [Ferruginibacter lapsinanis]|uniref:hypothetical protein n=1 Tax=Ferruginibacter lapsinanis TaxID=563172 RepID=UPI001E443B0F|nr:hypothetical protein [Ferruginibacter lapsinanis]UEG49323.1 hypothetical protein LK994_11835 [Ferruginibacter lapsinanis]